MRGIGVKSQSWRKVYKQSVFKNRFRNTPKNQEKIQRKLREAENKTTAFVPHNYKEPDFVSAKTKLTANYRANIVVALQKLRKKYPTKKEADTIFLELTFIENQNNLGYNKHIEYC